MLLKQKEILKRYTLSLNKSSPNNSKVNLSIQQRPIFKYFHLKSKSKHVINNYFSKSSKTSESTSHYGSSNKSSVFSSRRSQASSILTSSSRISIDQRPPFLYLNLKSKSRLAKESISKLDF